MLELWVRGFDQFLTQYSSIPTFHYSIYIKPHQARRDYKLNSYEIFTAKRDRSTLTG